MTLELVPSVLWLIFCAGFLSAVAIKCYRRLAR